MTKPVLYFSVWHATGLLLYAIGYWSPTLFGVLLDVGVSLAWVRFACSAKRAL
jgi:hypothetical protein